MNKEIIENLKIISDYEKAHKNTFKANAYDKVIRYIELLDYEIKKEDIENIKGAGKAIKEKILQYIEKGEMDMISKIQNDEAYVLRKKLLNIYGIGPAKVDEIQNKITKFEDLYKPENKNLLNTKQRIGLKYYEDMQKRIPYSEGKKHHTMIKKYINDDIVFEMVGSYRRKKPDMGDIDIIIQDHPMFDLNEFIEKLSQDGYIDETLALGKHKFMGLCRLNEKLPARRIDILVTEPSTYYFALLYFTGSYEFNIEMRKIALSKDLSLSEYGFKDIKTNKIIDTSDKIKSERNIFKYLGMKYISPTKR